MSLAVFDSRFVETVLLLCDDTATVVGSMFVVV